MPQANRRPNAQQNTRAPWRIPSAGREALAFGILLLAIWVPRALALDRFMTIDENNWLTRSANFYYALAHGDFAHTFQREHPGVTTMWAGSAAILARFPGYQNVGEGEATDQEYRQILREGGHTVVELLAAGRFFVVLAITAALLLAFVFARRLLGLLPAFIGFLLIALDPFHTAHSRLLHLDGLLSSFLLLALLAFLSFLDRRRPLDLIVSGAAGGLSWLTKSPGLFLIPIVAVLTAADLWRHRASAGDRPIAHGLWQSFWPLVVWGAVGLAACLLLWPATWVDLRGTLAGVLSPAMAYAEGGHSFPVFFDGTIYADGEMKGFLHPFYPTAYLWRSTPVVLFGLLAAAVASVRRSRPLDRVRTRHTAAGLLLSALVFALLINLGTKKFDRYLLPAYAPLDLVAALGWVAAGKGLKASRWATLRRYGAPMLLTAVVLVQAIGTARTYPYYLSYYNPMLGGSHRAPEVLTIGWGEGLDEAARYLNAQATDRKLRVAAWYDVCFAPFFSGRTRPIPLQSELDDNQMQQILQSDYAVIYIHQWQRQMPKQLLNHLGQQQPEHTITIDGLEYVRIYKLNGSGLAP